MNQPSNHLNPNPIAPPFWAINATRRVAGPHPSGELPPPLPDGCGNRFREQRPLSDGQGLFHGPLRHLCARPQVLRPDCCKRRAPPDLLFFKYPRRRHLPLAKRASARLREPSETMRLAEAPPPARGVKETPKQGATRRPKARAGCAEGWAGAFVRPGGWNPARQGATTMRSPQPPRRGCCRR
jgi:hypothetical protein